ncbi:MAG: hypothetical protein JJLCMIEE_01855 [Acidimicrobiales bacterium]|nr:hypothetical protein [Acidimicrobiales bacterium]
MSGQMKLTRLQDEHGGQSLELHPLVTVVTGLGPAARERVARAVSAIPCSGEPGLGGLVEAHGVVLDLTPENLDLLDLHDEVDVVVRSSDLPGSRIEGPATDSPADQPDDSPAVAAARRAYADNCEAYRILQEALEEALEEKALLEQALREEANAGPEHEPDQHGIGGGATSPEALALADELAALQARMAELEGQLGQEGRDIDVVTAWVDSARARLRAAESAVEVPVATAEDIESLERAHDEVLAAERKTEGRVGASRARRRLEEATRGQDELLAKMGFPTWSSYVMGAAHRGTDPDSQRELAEARREFERAEAEWAQLSAYIEADPDWSETLDGLERVHEQARLILGDVADDDVEQALRSHVVPEVEIHELAGLGGRLEDLETLVDARRSLLAAAQRSRDAAAIRLENLLGTGAPMTSEGAGAPEAAGTGPEAGGPSGTSAEAVEWYVLARLANQRAVSYAGSVPLVLDEPLKGWAFEDVSNVFDRLERMAEVVQVIYLSDDADVVSWGRELGEDRAAVVEAGARVFA